MNNSLFFHQSISVTTINEKKHHTLLPFGNKDNLFDDWILVDKTSSCLYKFPIFISRLEG